MAKIGNIREDHTGRENDEGFIHSKVRKLAEDAKRNLPIYKTISGFTFRKEPFEKNA